MPNKRIQSPRERACRALCEKGGLTPDIKFEGRPVWMSYLDEVDVVLQAALEPEVWERVRAAGPND